MIWSNGSLVPSYVENFGTMNPSEVLVDDMRAERCGEHVIQSPADRAGGTFTDQIPHWLLY